jgi:hypothetical protein
LVRFSNRCIDCTNSGFSFKSLHAQTRSFIPWRPCPRLPCQCYGPSLCHPRAAAAAAAAGDAMAGASPAAAAAAGGGVTSRSPAPPAPSAGGGAAGGTSTCGGEEASEVTVLVVMNGVGRFLVRDVGTGDRVDDEAEDVKLHHTSCVSPFAHHNDNLNQQTFK